MMRLGIKPGDMVKLTTRRGKINLCASIKERGIPTRGQVFVPS